jgi:leader peptidase (prepilin peptidase)/N-methyltransferase
VSGPALIGLAAGLAAGALAVPRARWLPRGIPERLAQPAWTRHAGRARVLVPVGGLAGLGVGLAAPDAAALAVGLVLVLVLVPACAIDVAWRVVPDSLLIAGALGSIAALAVLDRDALAGHLVAGVAAGLAALALAWLARGGLGLGDVKLAAMLGVALGAAAPRAVAWAILAAGLAALAVLARRGRGATVPLVPFLALGALAAITGPAAGLPSPF